MTAPDYSGSHYVYGGEMPKVPKPYIRMFPGPKLRRVRVRISQIIRHHHVNLSEQHNPIWNPAKGMWQECWSDVEGRGRVFADVFDTRGEAERYVTRIVTENFPPETHHVDTDVGHASGGDATPGYIKIARDAARRALRREGD